MEAQLELDIKKALRFMLTVHGTEFVKLIECLYRNETRHFESGNFKKTLSPGMEVVKINESFIPCFPYGWSSMEEWWKENPQYSPSATFDQVDNDSAESKSRGNRRFICFPTITASMMSVAKVIEIKGRFGKWFDNVEADQEAYEAKLNSIIPRFTNELLLEA